MVDMALVRKLHDQVVSLQEIEFSLMYRLRNVATVLRSITPVTGIRPICTYQHFIKNESNPATVTVSQFARIC